MEDNLFCSNPFYGDNFCYEFVSNGKGFYKKYEDTHATRKIFFTVSHRKEAVVTARAHHVPFDDINGFYPKEKQDILYDENSCNEIYNLVNIYEVLERLKHIDGMRIAFVTIPDDSIVFVGTRAFEYCERRIVVSQFEYFSVRSIKDLKINTWLEENKEKLNLTSEDISFITNHFYTHSHYFNKDFITQFFHHKKCSQENI
jgi:hypothetical protein